MAWHGRTSTLSKIDFERARRAIVQVGKHSRGFVCGGQIVTALSCLPHLPKFHPFEYDETGQTVRYENIIGRLGEAPSRSAICTFADIVSNIAILMELPETLEHEGTQYTGGTITGRDDHYRIRRPRGLGEGVETYHRIWLFTQDNQWSEYIAYMDRELILYEAPFSARNAPVEVHSQLSGSPIIDEEGAAIGMLCVPHTNDEKFSIAAGPILAWHLPGFLLG